MKDFEFSGFYNNRHLCDVLEDMRKCEKTKNFSPLLGLIEEAQILGNRMEAGLSDQKDLIRINEEYSKARKRYKELKKQLKQLESESKQQSE